MLTLANHRQKGDAASRPGGASYALVESRARLRLALESESKAGRLPCSASKASLGLSVSTTWRLTGFSRANPSTLPPRCFLAPSGCAATASFAWVLETRLSNAQPRRMTLHARPEPGSRRRSPGAPAAGGLTSAAMTRPVAAVSSRFAGVGTRRWTGLPNTGEYYLDPSGISRRQGDLRPSVPISYRSIDRSGALRVQAYAGLSNTRWAAAADI